MLTVNWFLFIGYQFPWISLVKPYIWMFSQVHIGYRPICKISSKPSYQMSLKSAIFIQSTGIRIGNLEKKWNHSNLFCIQNYTVCIENICHWMILKPINQSFTVLITFLFIFLICSDNNVHSSKCTAHICIWQLMSQ